METGGDDWSNSTRTVSTRTVTDRHDPREEVDSARRGVASFGGGAGPTPGQRLREFVRRYGWRAYALPVLVVVTVVALATARNTVKPAAPTRPAAGDQAGNVAAAGHGTAHGGPTAPPDAPASVSLKSDGSPVRNEPDSNGKLPAGQPYTRDGNGTFRVIPGGSGKVVGTKGPLFTYDIEVENGVKGVDLQRFADLVDTTLADPRSWSGHGVRLQRVPQDKAGFRITLTSSMTVRQYCGYDIPIETSCYAPSGSVAGLSVNRVVLNVARYVRGSGSYVGDLSTYRYYMINHEVGHALGHQHAHECLPDGYAPVMMQQTIGLKDATTGRYCKANAWPYPPGVKGAPGAEQGDTKQNSEYQGD